MNTKSTSYRNFWIVCIALLTACGTTPPAAETPIAATARPATETPTALPTFTPNVAMPSPLPTFTALSPIAFPTTLPNLTPPIVTPTQIPLPAVLPKFPLTGYVMLFTKDGDLYFQYGENKPIKLTSMGESSQKAHFSPKLSDDNQKVVFTRNDTIYSINTDGTREQAVISKDKMSSWGLDMKIGALRFVPHTHQLFFLAIQCKTQDNSPCPTSAFLANADKGEIRKLADLGSLFANLDFGEPRNIKISPDGKMLAVGLPDGMNIFTLDGNLIRDNILPFTPSTNSIVYPSLFWLPDSSGLIEALPDTTYYTIGHGYLPAHTIWRYTIEGNVTTKISLDPPPWMLTFDVSPDGNWVAYGGYSDPTLYVGNLANGHTQTFGEDGSHPFFFWAPDSKHLIVGWAILISFNKPLVTIGSGSEWIDANHFIYHDLPANNPEIRQERDLIAEIKDDNLFLYDPEILYSSSITIKQK